MSKIMPRKMCHFCKEYSELWVPIIYSHITVIVCSLCFKRRIKDRAKVLKAKWREQLRLPFKSTQ
jgi:hypothetical protein